MEATSRPAAPSGTAESTPVPLEETPAPRRASGFWTERPVRRGVLDPRTVTVGEVAVFGIAVLVGIVAVASLAAAHLHHYSLGLAAAFTLIGLVVLGVVAVVAGRPPRVVLDLPGLAILAGAGILALFMFLPGYHYAAGDRDPGGYMMTGSAIAHTGSVEFTDPVLASDLPVQVQSPGARFRGIWISDQAAGTITPQFYHLWSALLATANKLHGFAGQSNTDPLVGVIGVLLLVCLARRVGGLVAAGAAGLLMSTHMMQVWQAKYPTAEVFTQMLYVGAVLGLVIALQTRWRWPAFVAGALIGAGWLARPDGVLLVLLAVGIGATLYVLRRFDARGWWFAGGLGLVGLYGAYQAYGPAELYTRANGIPKLTVIAGLVALCVVGALVLRPVFDRLSTRVVGRRTDEIEVTPTWQSRLGWAVVGLYVFLFGLALIRPAFGADYINYLGKIIPSYDERSVYWLSWFFTWPGLLLILVGIAAVALQRWTPAVWVMVLPTLLLVPVYMYHAKNSPFLMWWGRRYVSTALPGMVLLMALGLAAVFHLGWRYRSVLPAFLVRAVDRLPLALPRVASVGAAALTTAFLLTIYLHQSLPLRQHDEWGGSYFVAKDVAALGNNDGVFLWQRDQYCCAAPPTLFAGPLWLEQGQISVLFPSSDKILPGYVKAYVTHFPDKPVFLIYQKGEPPAMPGLTVTKVQEFAGTLPRWGESSITRPASAIQIPYNFTVYRVTTG